MKIILSFLIIKYCIFASNLIENIYTCSSEQYSPEKQQCAYEKFLRSRVCTEIFLSDDSDTDTDTIRGSMEELNVKASDTVSNKPEKNDVLETSYICSSVKSLSTKKTFKESNKLECHPENDILELNLPNDNDRYRERLHGEEN